MRWYSGWLPSRASHIWNAQTPSLPCYIGLSPRAGCQCRLSMLAVNHVFRQVKFGSLSGSLSPHMAAYRAPLLLRRGCYCAPKCRYILRYLGLLYLLSRVSGVRISDGSPPPPALRPYFGYNNPREWMLTSPTGVFRTAMCSNS
jgi:hypothetical protein